VTFGFNRYVLESLLTNDKFKNYWIIIVTMLQPIDPRLKQRFQKNEKNISELIFVEMNYWWSFQNLISNECKLKTDIWEKKIKHIRKYDLYPIFQEEI
jgi:hypothetical protein